MAYTDFQTKREGVTYATGFVSDCLCEGPFKLGESGDSGYKRLKDSKTYLLEPMTPRKQWKFFDRIWAEAVLFRLLAAYRVPRMAGERRQKEFFNCSLAVVEAAIQEVYRLEAVEVKAMRRGMEFIKDNPPPPELISSNRILNGVLTHRLKGKRTLGDCAYDALYAPTTSVKLLRQILECGMRCFPMEKLVIFRVNDTSFDSFLKNMGFHDWKAKIGNIVGFDNDGHPVSRREFKTRCPGYDHCALLA